IPELANVCKYRTSGARIASSSCTPTSCNVASSSTSISRLERSRAAVTAIGVLDLEESEEESGDVHRRTARPSKPESLTWSLPAPRPSAEGGDVATRMKGKTTSIRQRRRPSVYGGTMHSSPLAASALALALAFTSCPPPSPPPPNPSSPWVGYHRTNASRSIPTHASIPYVNSGPGVKRSHPRPSCTSRDTHPRSKFANVLFTFLSAALYCFHLSK
ncbi:hypothetical protein BD410DRAFT_781487, partial [Rickenella mellea]